jgi:hypothetical protein
LYAVVFYWVLSARQAAAGMAARLAMGAAGGRLSRLPKPGRLVERFEWHYTPKHGSWLDLAESELGVVSVQCLDRRIADKQTLIDEIAAWERGRNAHHTKSDWHFTTKDAPIKLKHLHPSI